MKKNILAIAILFICFSVNAQESVSKDSVTDQIVNFSNTLTSIMPENITALNVWPEAHIGKFFPAFPPHFGFGISAAGTLIDTSFAKDTFDTLSKLILKDMTNIKLDFECKDIMVLPTCAINARLGGFLLPFDIGVFGIATIPDLLEKFNFGDFDASVDYFTFGGDIRYAIYEGNIFMPKVSLGVGYFYAQQELNFDINKTKSAIYNDVETNVNINANANLLLKTHTFFAQMQISKKILIITPFIGARAYYTFFENECNWNYKTQIVNGESPTPIANDGQKVYITNKKLNTNNIRPQVYLGVGLNAPILQVAINVSWNPITNYWSGGSTLNFKL